MRRIRFDRLVTVLIISIWFIYSLFLIAASISYKVPYVYVGSPKLVDSYKGDIDLTFDEVNALLEEEMNEAKARIEYEKSRVYLGSFKLTGYCACEKCCGKWANGITATGTYAEAGRTIAVDPSIIPLGSKVEINGTIYTAEDTGGAINQNRIDIFCSSHDECFSAYCNGYANVYLINGV